MKSCLGSITSSLLMTALLLLAEPRAALAWQSAVFQVSDARDCGQKSWNAQAGGSVRGTVLGFNGCADVSGWHGNGTPNDPYRLALDGENESVEIDGLEATTGTDYTVQVWFRMRTNKKGLAMLVDSRTDRFYAPLRMRIANGNLQCSIEMPFPDRIYLTSPSVPIATSRWHNAACRYRAQARELSLFLDGSPSGSTRVPPGTIRSNRIRIGGDPSVPGENFPGDIAGVVFSATSDDAGVIQGRCKQESERFAGAECRK